MFLRARILEALGGGIVTCDGVMACSISGRLGRVHHISYLFFMCKHLERMPWLWQSYGVGTKRFKSRNLEMSAFDILFYYPSPIHYRYYDRRRNRALVNKSRGVQRGQLGMHAKVAVPFLLIY